MVYIPIEYPVVKPHKCVSSVILSDLIFLNAYSEDEKEGDTCVRRIINNSQICQKERKISPIEISELRVIETFLLDVKRYYRIYGDRKRFRLYLAKNAEFNNWMMFLVGSLMYSVFYYHYGAPTSFQLFFVMLFLAIVLLMLESGKLFERLFYTVPPPIEESNVRNEGKWLRLKYTPVHSAQSMEKEQLALIDLRSSEVLPVKEEYHQLNTEVTKMRLRSIAPICLFLLICVCCFVIRVQTSSIKDIKDEQYLCLFFTSILFVFGYLIAFASIVLDE